MRQNILLKTLAVFTVMFFPAVVFACKASYDTKKAEILKQAYCIQVPFIENVGQVKNKDVRFYAKTFGGTIFVQKDGALTYNLAAKDKKGVVIKEIFTDKGIKVEGLNISPTRVNYFTGKDKRDWKTDIPSYESISLGKIYKGIDLTLKAYGNNVEKLFTVLPEEDPQIIRIKIAGAKGLKVNEKGELVLITELGPVRFTKPLAYQNIEAEKKAVEVAYLIHEEDTYGFKIGNYDKKRPLIIDPLLASTFIGGGDWEYGYSIALDGENVYVTGYTHSSNYPVTPDAYDKDFSGGYDGDVFVSKLDSDLSTLSASTYIGGGGGDSGDSIALDGAGNVYVTGRTSSSDYPTTPGAYDESHNVNYDVFVSKLDSDLSTLSASTFIGGSHGDGGHSIALDGENVYVTGYTYSFNYPVTPGAYDEIHNGDDDVFVSKLDMSLSTLLASTYIGGSDRDGGHSIALDGDGNVYVTGYASSDYPTTPGAYDESFNDIACDVFVSKLNMSLSTLLASTFIGGGGGDVGHSIALDGENVYVTGFTCSSDYPTTPEAYDESCNDNDCDVFVSKLDNNLSALLFVILTPDSTSVPRGGILGFDVTITNNTDEDQTIYFATNVTLPNGNIYPPFGYLFGPVPIFLNPHQSKSGHLSHTIPIGAPLGAYTYHGYIGKPSEGIIDDDHFDFQVTGTGAEQVVGPEDWETTVDKAFTE